MSVFRLANILERRISSETFSNPLSVYSQAATILKILQVSAGSASALFLVVLMVGSASAAPLLSVGNSANYQLNASMQSTQSCNATPATYN